MFGEVSGPEKHVGVMNQYVVSRAISPTHVYWMFHTRGEDPISILMQDLQDQAVKGTMTRDAIVTLVSGITDKQTFRNAADYNKVAQTEVTVWGTGRVTSLDALVTGHAAESCVLAFEKRA